MVDQEAFTRVVQHLRAQGQKSEDGTEGCAYRSKQGLRCAVGVLITDEFYLKEFEGDTVLGGPVEAMLTKALPGVSLDLLADLQGIHDMHEVEDWEYHWSKLAEQFGLEMPPEEVADVTRFDVEAPLPLVRATP